MTNRSLIPWRKRDYGEAATPMVKLQREMNQLFNEFFEGWNLPTFSTHDVSLTPTVDVAESEKEVKVTAELPGIDEKNVDISVVGNALTISGEKKEEKEEKGQTYHRIERTYGSFSRTVPLPAEVDEENTRAVYKNGILTITLPKVEQARRRRIEVKTEK
ncbi:MAG TPA: Hsp20/alpha crystallin family protein [Candidatus Brocadiia bacterium]|nr:Hsp20/alpha crystallin family protein [Candidatus Brocadiia bacterium]